jgi:hypothetical protein
MLRDSFFNGDDFFGPGRVILRSFGFKEEVDKVTSSWPLTFPRDLLADPKVVDKDPLFNGIRAIALFEAIDSC